MKRKLPVYVIVDTSGSMVGESIEAVKNSSKLLIRSLRKDPQAQETVEISFLEFNSQASVLIPMTDIPNVQEPSFVAGGSTSLGAVIDLLADCIKTDVQKGDTKTEQKGDYKPLVFLLTDGFPTDDRKTAIERFDKKSVNFIASCGVPGADMSVLEKISGSDYVIELSSATEDDIAKYFQWISQSIQVASVSVSNSSDENFSPSSLPAMPNQEAEVLL